MRKIYLTILIILVVFVGIWYIKKTKSITVDKTIARYSNTDIGISFVYPKILSASTTEDSVTLHHEIIFPHRNFCDFKGDVTTTLTTLTDFNISFHIESQNLIDTIKTYSPYLSQDSFVNGEILESPGFIDSVKIGGLNGYKIFEGAEGCGFTTYYFPISGSKTLVIKSDLITVFTGAITKDVEDKVIAIPGVINQEQAKKIFEDLLTTLKAQ